MEQVKNLNDVISNVTRIDKERNIDEEYIKSLPPISKEIESNILTRIVFRNGPNLVEEYHSQERKLNLIINDIFNEVAEFVYKIICFRIEPIDDFVSYENLMKYLYHIELSYNSSYDKPQNIYDDALYEINHLVYFEDTSLSYLGIAHCITRYLFYGEMMKGVRNKWTFSNKNLKK